MYLKKHSAEISQDEIDLLEAFLGELLKRQGDISFTAIADIPGELGLEIFRASKKIAEVYCAEDKDGKFLGLLQVHAEKDWENAVFLTVSEAVDYVRH